MLFGSLYLLFYSLTPKRYRTRGCPKWPGPLFVTIWWLATTALLPVVLASLGGYDLTYGSLAGVIIGLTFFFIVGLGVVIGAELNAALAEMPEEALKEGEEPFYKQGKHMTGLMERKARPDHGPRQRQVAGLGHRQGAWRSRAPSSLSPIRARRCRSGSARSPTQLGSRLPDRLRRRRHGRSRPPVRDA